LASAKKRVATYLPNLVLEKMEGKESVDETCLAGILLSKRAGAFC